MSVIFAAVLMAQTCAANQPCDEPVEVARFVQMKSTAQYCQPTADYWNAVARNYYSKTGEASVLYFCKDLKGKQS